MQALPGAGNIYQIVGSAIIFHLVKVLVILGNAVVISIVLVLLLVAPPDIPLYYSRSWGENQLASKWALILLPVLMNMAFAVCAWIMYTKFPEEMLLHRIVRFALVMNVVLTVSILMRLFFMIQF